MRKFEKSMERKTMNNFIKIDIDKKKHLTEWIIRLEKEHLYEDTKDMELQKRIYDKIEEEMKCYSRK